MHPHRSSASSTGGREPPVDSPQPVRDASPKGSRYRRFPALASKKPPWFSVCVGTQRWFRSDDELVDLYPGSGAVAAGRLADTAALSAKAS